MSFSIFKQNDFSTSGLGVLRGGKEEGSKEGRREREEGRMEGGWKRMLLLLGDHFNHPGEKTLLKQCWGRKKNKTKQ